MRRSPYGLEQTWSAEAWGREGPSSRQSNGEDAGSLDAGQVRTKRRMSMTLGRTCLVPLSSNLPVLSLR